MDHTIDEVLANVQSEGTAEAGVAALVKGLQDQVAAILAGSVLPPAVQTKLNAVFDAVDANKAAIALTTTPAGAPVPPVPGVPDVPATPA